MSSVLEQVATEAGKDPVIIRRVTAPLFWSWFALHRHDRVSIPARFWRRSVSLDELHALFMNIFGADINGSSQTTPVGAESKKDAPRRNGSRA